VLPSTTVVEVNFQVAIPSGNSHIVSALHVNDKERVETRWVSGDAVYSTNVGVTFIELPPGHHVFTVKYRTPATLQGGLITDPGSTDTETRSITVVGLPGAKILSQMGIETSDITAMGTETDANWHQWPGLAASIDVETPTLVEVVYQISLDTKHSHISSQLFVDDVEKPQARFTNGNTQYGSNIGIFSGFLPAGLHTFHVKYKAEKRAEMTAGGLDWQTRALTVVAMPSAARILLTETPSNQGNIVGDDAWTVWPNLAQQTVTLEIPALVMVVYQISADTGNSYLFSRLYVDGVEASETRSTVGNQLMGGNVGVWYGELTVGSHYFDVKYRTSYGTYNNPGTMDWQTRSITVVALSGPMIPQMLSCPDESVTAIQLPGSSPLTLATSWTNFGEGYRGAMYKKQGEICVVSGEVTLDADVWGHIATLAEECRPSGRLIFNLNNRDYTNRVDVLSSGEIRYEAGVKHPMKDLSLTGLTFSVAAEPLSLLSTWTNGPSPYLGAEYDLQGALCVVSGLVQTERNFENNPIAILPAECRPPNTLIFNVNNHESTTRVDVKSDGTIEWAAGGKFHGWLSLSGIVFEVSGGRDLMLEPSVGWASHGSPYHSASVIKEGNLCVASGRLDRTGDNARWDAIAIMPAECRPSEILAFNQNMHDMSTRIELSSDGKLYYGGGSKAESFISLSGMVWEAKGQLLSLVLGTTDFEPSTYRIGRAESYGDLCVVSGAVNPTTWTDIAKVQGNCIPNGRLVFGMNHGDETTRIDIDTSGNLGAHGGSMDIGFVSLSGIVVSNGGDALVLSGKWQNYGSGYRGATIEKVGNVCFVSGMVKGTDWENIATLPKQCQPESNLVFGVVHDDEMMRIDVQASGLLEWKAGHKEDHEWLSLTGITFAVAGMTDLSLGSGWKHQASPYKGGSWMKQERVCVLGGVVMGENWDHIATLPEDCRPDKRLIFAVNNDDGTARIDIQTNGKISWHGGQKNHGWVSLSGIIFDIVNRDPQVCGVATYNALSSFVLSGVNEWTSWPGLTKSIKLTKQSVVMARYQVTVDSHALSDMAASWIMSKLFVDKVDQHETRSATGDQMYTTNYGTFFNELSLGEHEFDVQYKTLTAALFSEDSDWMTRTLVVIELPGASIAAKLIPTTEYTMSGTDMFVLMPGLSKTITLQQKALVQAVYQIAAPAAGRHITTKIFVDSVERPETRAVWGNSDYATNTGTYWAELGAGQHSFEVKYSTTATDGKFTAQEVGSTSSAGTERHTPSDWQTRALSIILMPTGSDLLSQVIPLSKVLLEGNNWKMWPGLHGTVVLRRRTMLMVTYATSTPGGATTMRSRLLVDGLERDETRSAVGDSFYAFTSGLYVGELPVGTHTFEVQYRTPGTLSFDDGGDFWQTRTLSVVAVGSKGDGDILGEAGTVVMDENDASVPCCNKKTIYLQNTYANAVVFAQPLSKTDEQPASVRIERVSNNVFSIYIQQPENGDNKHLSETVAYVVLEAGKHTLNDGSTIEAGLLTSNKASTQHESDQWETIIFGGTYATVPAFFTQIQSSTENGFATTRQKDVTLTSGKVILDQSEATNLKAVNHAEETIGWMVFTIGSGEWPAYYESGSTADVSQFDKEVKFGVSVESPVFMAAMRTMKEKDAAWLRYKDLGPTDVKISIEEDDTNDAERSHTPEEVNWLVTQPGLILGQRGGMPFYEATIAEKVTELSAFTSSDDEQWSDWPGLTRSLVLAEEVVVQVSYQVSLFLSQKGSLASKLFVDDTEVKETRSISGGVDHSAGEYVGNIGVYFVKLTAGNHNFRVKYKVSKAIITFLEDGDDWQTRTLSVLALPGAEIAAAANPLTSMTMVQNEWTKYSGLTVSISLDVPILIQAVYLISGPASQSHFASKMFVDGQEQTSTRSVSGNGEYGTNFGVFWGQLLAGAHTFEVQYRTPGVIAFEDGGLDWQTRYITIIKHAKEARLIAQVTPLRPITITGDSWQPWPGLTKTISLAASTLIQVNYQIAVPAGSAHVFSKLFVDGMEQPETRFAEGDAASVSNFGIFTAKLVAGTHTFEVQYKTTGEAQFVVGGDDWQTRSISITALSGTDSMIRPMVIWHTDTQDTGWSNHKVTETEAGSVHGPWGGDCTANKCDVERIFALPTHFKLHITARFWAIDSWDSERAYMHVDDSPAWSQVKSGGTCTGGFKQFVGDFPNTGNGDGDKCYFDIDFARRHTNKNLKLMFGSSIGSSTDDESFAFSNVRISIDGTCTMPGALGMASGGIPVEHVSASSEINSEHSAHLGRLRSPSSWVAKTNEIGQWYQIDVGATATITAVATQGRPDAAHWITQYTIQFSTDAERWNSVLDENGATKNFGGNSDQTTVVTNEFKDAFATQYVRFSITGWHQSISARFEIYGCLDPYNIDGGGWELVRRVMPGPSWHPTDDELSGIEAYGEATTDPGAFSTFSVAFNQKHYNEMLFATGDASKWLITTKAEAHKVGGSNFEGQILKSSLSSVPYKAKWMHRVAHKEDPLISLEDYDTAIENGNILYGANAYGNMHASMLPEHNGANVFIRQQPAAMVIWHTDINDRDWSNVMTTNVVGYGPVHGPWGGDCSNRRCDVERVFKPLPTHTKVRLQARMWSIGIWKESERGYVDVDGIEIWSRGRTKDTSSECKNGFSSYSANGDPLQDKCYYEIDVSILHTAAQLKVVFGCNIAGPETISWGFSNVRISVEGSCKVPSAFGVGVRNLAIVDDFMSASSEAGADFRAAFGRLRRVGACWSAMTNDADQWLQLNLNAIGTFHAVQTQGRDTESVQQWVTAFRVTYSSNSLSWANVVEGGVPKVFKANSDRNAVVTNIFSQPFNAQYVRVHPTEWHGGIAMRIEWFGCRESAGIGGGGWELVRRVKTGVLWHEAEDSLKGEVAYGTASDDPQSDKSFSVKFDDKDYNQMLFATGDFSKWLIADSKEVKRAGGLNFEASIITSSSHAGPYTAKWTHRSHVVDDPQIGLEDVDVAHENGSLLYAENSQAERETSILREHDGANVYIRKQPGPMTIYLTDTSESGWSDDRIQLHDDLLAVHGPWGGNEVTVVTRTFTLPPHEEVRLQVRVWSIDTWDGEFISVKVDGDIWWQQSRMHGNLCANGFTQYQGDFPNPHSSAHNVEGKCYADIDVTKEHHSLDLKLSFETSITGDKNQESWAFSNVRISLEGDCLSPKALGMENMEINDVKLSASSMLDENSGPIHARLHLNTAWSAKTDNRKEWLQVDVGMISSITAIATQGRPNADDWVSRYQLQYSSDLAHWNPYLVENKPMEFVANSDRSSVVTNTMKYPFNAQFLRLHPIQWSGHISMRVEVYGCRNIMRLDGGGWELVRRVTSGGTWHPATDLCDGSESSYGVPSQDPQASGSFGITFKTHEYNQILFATGDATKWLITSKQEVARIGSNFEAAILKSSTSSSPYKAKWMHRTDHEEDPIICLEDYEKAVTNANVLYAGNSDTSSASILTAHDGANVFVRNYEPPLVIWHTDTQDVGWSNSHITNTGYGVVHGIWGGETPSVERTFVLPEHSRLRIQARFWAIDSWDAEKSVYGCRQRQLVGRKDSPS
jgi:hypothetical protein